MAATVCCKGVRVFLVVEEATDYIRTGRNTERKPVLLLALFFCHRFNRRNMRHKSDYNPASRNFPKHSLEFPA